VPGAPARIAGQDLLCRRLPAWRPIPEIKALEARKAIRDGANEIDMVINIGALKSKDEPLVLRDIRAVVEASRDGRALSKVIFETALLTTRRRSAPAS